MDNGVQKTPESSLAQMVEQIMKNPEFTGIVNELRGASGDAPAASPVSQTEILSRLPDVMAMLGPLIGENNASSGGKPEDTPVTEAEKESPKPPEEEPSGAVSAFQPKKYDRNRAEKLMAALKPYLNPNRCEIIDKCVSVIQITDIVGALQGIEGLTKTK